MAEGHAFDFTALQQTLLDWPVAALPPTGGIASPLLGRLRQILEGARMRGAPESPPDLMVLVRQLLIARSTENRVERLSVPRGHGWPSAEAWRGFGFDVTPAPERLLLEPRPWRPDWLGGLTEGHSDIFEPEHQARVARAEARVPMDPFLREVTGFADYVCPGQREALLSALFMPAGSTLIVNLPTGAGKSLVAQAPLLVRGPDAGLTLFVVPTNALALDLERRTQALLHARDPRREPFDLAWIGGRPQASRDSIHRRVRAGGQGILFASPEAVCGALLPALYQAAERDALSHLVVDEAHLIAQWGDAFRPAFQQLAGVRRGLLASCPGNGLRTLLLSATFSRPVVETLEALFGPPEQLQFVSAVHLRPEPRYISRRVSGREDKRERLLELLRYVPRPFILYSTTRQDARDWYRELRAAGYARIACFHGETPDAERERVISDWVNDQLDGVVATSAFGVGMDKADVRTVIHAALPETLDRFYQEVGRGGRDGRASLSITLFDTRDERIARRMTTPTLIGDDRGFARWSTLYRQSETDPSDPDLHLLDLRRVPSGLTQQTDYNRDWNMRTLILLARAGLIRLESVRPPAPQPTTDGPGAVVPETADNPWEDYFAQIPVRSLDPRLMDQAHFEHRIGSERQRGAAAAERAFAQMLDALDGRQEMADVLANLFSSDAPGRTVLVSPACRGCPASGGAPHPDSVLYQIPPGIGIERIATHDNATWRQRFPGLDPALVVLCPSSGWPDGSVLTAVTAAVALFGVSEVAAARALWEGEPALAHLHRSARGRILVRRDLEDDLPGPHTLPLARATLLLPWDARPLPDEIFLLDRPLHIVLAPHDIADARHPLRRWRDTATNCIELNDFLRRATR